MPLNGSGARVYVLADLDGTVNDETVVESERLGTIGHAREAFRVFSAAGVAVGIVTARSFGEALRYQAELGLTRERLLICEDGAVVMLPPTDAQWARVDGTAVLDVAHTEDGTPVFLLTTHTRPRIEAFLAEAACRFRVVASCTADPETLRERLGHQTLAEACVSAERLASAYVLLEDVTQQAEFAAFAAAHDFRTFGAPIHLIGKDADKGKALAFVARVLDRHAAKEKRSSLPIVFGNSVNDVRLFESCHALGGIPVVVGKPGGGFDIPDDQLPPYVMRVDRPHGHGIIESIPRLRERLAREHGVAI